MKDTTVIAVFITIGIVAMGLLLALISWDADKDAQEDRLRCQENVKLTSVKEWKYVDSKCLIVKDGKIEEIK